MLASKFEKQCTTLTRRSSISDNNITYGENVSRNFWQQWSMSETFVCIASHVTCFQPMMALSFCWWYIQQTLLTITGHIDCW